MTANLPPFCTRLQIEGPRTICPECSDEHDGETDVCARCEHAEDSINDLSEDL